jgi:hypothetical protein
MNGSMTVKIDLTMGKAHLLKSAKTRKPAWK